MEQNIITVLNDNKSLFTRKVIQNADAKLAILVPETHNAILVKDGQMLQTLSSGKYTLENFVDLKNDTNSTLEVLFMSKTAKLKLLWGTPSKFLVYDDKLQENYHIGLSGSFEVQIADCRRCYLYLVGVAESLMADELQERLMSNVVSTVEEVVAKYIQENKILFNQVVLKKREMAQKTLTQLSQKLKNDYGIAVFSFDIANIIIDEDDLKRLSKMLKGEQKIVCSGCGTALDSEAKFCYNCGRKVGGAKICPNCQTENNDEAKFCYNCGEKL